MKGDKLVMVIVTSMYHMCIHICNAPYVYIQHNICIHMQTHMKLSKTNLRKDESF